jgi:hypothetical protein
VSEEAKSTLGMTIWNDTLFLSSLNVMDYSLVVGIDEDNNDLVVGIIGEFCLFSLYMCIYLYFVFQFKL